MEVMLLWPTEFFVHKSNNKINGRISKYPDNISLMLAIRWLKSIFVGMEKYFVDMPFMDYSSGFMSGTRIVEAESSRDALAIAGSPAMVAFPETAPFRAVRVPAKLLGLSNDEILNHFDELRNELGEKKFYRKVMGVKGYKPIKKAPARFYIGDREVSEEEFFDS